MQSEILHVDPHLPPRWTALRFPLVWGGQPLYITIDHAGVAIEHRGTTPLPARIAGQACALTPGRRHEVRMPNSE
jgi:trehalose/maltose hydrolase-like predicted phosphorylase